MSASGSGDGLGRRLPVVVFSHEALDQHRCIGRLAAGRNPDADGKPLPAGLSGAPDPRRIGMFGTSKGGTATALATGMDERIRAGLSMDGPMEPLITTDLDRPFMLMTTDYTRATLPVRHPQLAVSAPAINPAARTTPRATR